MVLPFYVKYRRAIGRLMAPASRRKRTSITLCRSRDQAYEKVIGILLGSFAAVLGCIVFLLSPKPGGAAVRVF